MTYNTPELLSVGTAQNLVLGFPDKFAQEGRTNHDDNPAFYKAETGPCDACGW